MPGSVCNENHGFILGALWGLQDQLVELHLSYKQEKKGCGPCEPIECGLGSSLLSWYLLLSIFLLYFLSAGSLTWLKPHCHITFALITVGFFHGCRLYFALARCPVVNIHCTRTCTGH